MIETAINRAFKRMNEKNWDCIYIAVDLHGPVVESTYNDEIYIVPECLIALDRMSKCEKTKIIFFSSSTQEYMEKIAATIRQLYPDFKVDYFNENPEVENTTYGRFDDKFYYDLIIDDKAGFEDEDWATVARAIFWETIY